MQEYIYIGIIIVLFIGLVYFYTKQSSESADLLAAQNALAAQTDNTSKLQTNLTSITSQLADLQVKANLWNAITGFNTANTGYISMLRQLGCEPTTGKMTPDCDNLYQYTIRPKLYLLANTIKEKAQAAGINDVESQGYITQMMLIK